MTTKYSIQVVDQPFFVGDDLWIQAYIRQKSGNNDKKITKFKYICYNVSEDLDLKKADLYDISYSHSFIRPKTKDT